MTATTKCGVLLHMSFCTWRGLFWQGLLGFEDIDHEIYNLWSYKKGFYSHLDSDEILKHDYT